MFLLASGFYIINCKSNHLSQREQKALLVTILTQIKTLREVRMLQVPLLLLPLLLSLSKQIFNRKLNMEIEPFITLPKYIGSFTKTSQCGQKGEDGKENNQKNWKTSLATDENQDVCLCERLFSKPTLVYN